MTIAAMSGDSQLEAGTPGIPILFGEDREPVIHRFSGTDTDCLADPDAPRFEPSLLTLASSPRHFNQGSKPVMINSGLRIAAR